MMQCDHNKPRPLLTILTPTYNRRHLLPRLYGSIIKQGVPDGTYEWLVIDDGSTDDTAAYLAELSARHPGWLRFAKQSNGGKHRALNAGADQARGKWIMVVDSDDWLTDRSLSKAIDTASKNDKNQQIGIIISPLVFPNKPAINQFRLKKNPCTFVDRLAFEPWFDICALYRASVMKSFPFPEIPNERFLAEGWQYFQIDRYFFTLLTNDHLVCAEYQEDGLSANSLIIRRSSPIGAIVFYNESLSHKLPWPHKIRWSINRGRFWWHALEQGRQPKNHGQSAKAIEIAAGVSIYILDRLRLMLKTS